MLAFFWVILFLLAAYIFLLMPLLVGVEYYRRYRGSRSVICPENHRQVAVGLDAVHAAATQLAGTPELRLAECTRWPERGDCGQECLPQALRTSPYTKGEIAAPHSKPIYHLPVLIAAFAAWTLGAVWHSQYLFRTPWAAAVGLSRAEVHQLVWRLAPHFLSLAVPLLFAYGVAWLLAWSKRKGSVIGVAEAVALWALIGGIALASTGFRGLSPSLLWIELTYTFLASAVVGAIIGGLSGKLVEQSFTH
jgi:hypothetical protein